MFFHGNWHFQNRQEHAEMLRPDPRTRFLTFLSMGTPVPREGM